MTKFFRHSLFSTGGSSVFFVLILLLPPTALPVCAQDETPESAASPETASAEAPPAESPAEEASDKEPDVPEPDEGEKAEGEKAEGGEAENEKPSEPEEPPVELPFDIRPYTVRVEMAFGGACLGPESAEDVVLEKTRQAVARMYGAVWSVDIHRNDWVVPSNSRRLARLTLPEVIDRYSEQESQKVFLLSVESVGSAFLVSCREYDAKVRELTPVYDELTRDSRAVPSIAARLMRDAFRPNVLFLRNVENEEGKALMELQVQAGAITPPDPSAEQVVEGDVLRSFTRQMERRDPYKVKSLRAYPLSYVRVLGVDRTVARGLVSGIYLTHLRMSLFGAKGRRMQHLALRQRPTAENSRVRIVLQGRPDKPLVSHRLAIAYQLYWKDEEDGPQTQLVTDRNGEVVVESRDNHPTFWIRVYSGTSLLARVPYAPGLLPYDVIELPDDSVRLSVEGEIKLLADELVDAIALREVLMARATSAAEAGSGQQVKELLDVYETVPGKKVFLEKISNIRIPAVRRATERRLGTRGIKQLCDGLESTVTRFFSDEKRAKRQIEIDQLRRTAP